MLGLRTPEAIEQQAKKDTCKPPEEAAVEKLEQAEKAQEELKTKTRQGKGAKKKGAERRQ